MLPLVLAALLLEAAVAPSSPLPTWVGALPEPTKKPNEGLPVLPGARRVTVYNSSSADGGRNPEGLYNHGPMVMFVTDALSVDPSLRRHFIAAWYNGPEHEGKFNRVVLASSPGQSTAISCRLFPNQAPEPVIGRLNLAFFFSQAPDFYIGYTLNKWKTQSDGT